MYKNCELCMTIADNFFGYLFAGYIPDFPNSQISSNPPNCYQQCLVQMIYWHMAHQLHKWLSLANTWIIPRYNLHDMSSTYIEISPLLLQLKEIEKLCKLKRLPSYSDWLKTISLNIEQTRKPLFEHRTSSNECIYWWLNSNTWILASNERTSNIKLKGLH